MRKEIQIAILAIVTIAASIWGFKFISGTTLFSGDKLFYAVFENVKDVNTATPVLINGYQVGTVVSINPVPEDIKQIKVGFQVKKSIALPDYTVVELRSSSPLGGKELELVFDKMCSGDNCAPNKSVLKGVEVGILGSLISAEEIEPHVESLTSGLNETLSSLGNPDSDAPMDVAIVKLSETMNNLASTTAELDKLMSNSSRNLERMMSHMATLSGSLIETNEKLTSVLTNVDSITADLKSASLSETISKSNATFDQATSSLAGLEDTMEEANVTLQELTELLKKASSDESSLGALLNEKGLYNNMEETTANLNLLLQDMRLNPRRYFRLFGKKSPEYVYPDQDPAMINIEDK